jgi:predicted transcriptional regulator
MTTAQQLLETLGIDYDDAARRFTRASRRAQRTGARWGRLARERLPEMRNAPMALNGVPPAYLWIGAGILGAAVMAAMMRNGGRSANRGRTVGDVMVKDVLTIEASASIQEAAQRMREANVGVLPVVEAGRLRGVITDRDLVIRGLARGMDPAQTPVRYIATEDLACARADWDVEDAMQVMSDCQVGRLPVIDDEHRVIGIVTLSSLALRSREQTEALDTAKEVSKRSARSA